MQLLYSKIYKDDIAKAIEKYDFTFLRDKTVLVTGGLGLIGSAVTDALLVLNDIEKLNVEIIVGARNQSAFEERYGKIEGVSFLYYDALKPFSVDRNVDFIIQAAGLASPELYINAPVETMLSNISGIQNVLEYAKQHKTKIVYISSSEVYGTKDTEDAFVEGKYGFVDIDKIRSSYPEAKRAAEMLCRSFASEYGVEVVMARPGYIYGPSAQKRDKRVSSDFAYKAAIGENIEMLSSGLQKRSYVYSVDCAMAILVMLKNGVSGEAYNIANEDIVTLGEMARCYATAGGVELRIATPTEEELRAFNPMNNSVLDHRKLQGIGYNPSFSSIIGYSHTVAILRDVIKMNEERKWA